MKKEKPEEKPFIQFSRASIDDREIKEVVETLKSGWITTGPRTQKFEEAFADYVGAKYAIGLTSCTAALHLALLSHGIGEGDEVIVPALTFAATANMVENVGATPVFVDILPDIFTLDPDDVLRKITKKTKAIIPVHYAGHPYDIAEIDKIARKHKLIVIEDAAHAVGTEYKGRKIGSFGNATCFSFYPTKTMTTGEGGMLTTNNKRVANFVRTMRLHGITKDGWKRYAKGAKWRYHVTAPGWKYHMFDLQAALGLHQIKKVDSFIKARQKYAKYYNKAFADISEIQLPIERGYLRHPYHLYSILLTKYPRNKFITDLQEQNIGTTVCFAPLHLEPYYKNKYKHKKGDLPVSERVFSQIVSLPLYPSLSKKDAKRVVETVRKILTA